MSRQNRLVARASSRRFGVAGVPTANLLFSDDFTAFSVRNGTPTGVNKFRNSRWYTPPGDAFPENWDAGGGFTSGGVSRTLVGSGAVTLDGQSVPYIDIRFQGAASAGDHAVAFDRQVIACAASQTWTVSGYMAVAAGSLANVNSVTLVAEYDDADNETAAVWTGGAYASANALTGTMARYSASAATSANSRGIRPLLFVNTAAAAVDVTVRLAGVQVEQAGSATALVQTTSNGGTWNTRHRWGPNTSLNANSPLGAEAQYYVDTALHGTAKSNGANPFDASTEAGVLRITGAAVPGGQSASYANNKAYTSGAITTLNSFKRQYGYFEMHARYGIGSGVWPAFWLLPSVVNADGSRITAAEIDVLEYFGSTPNAVTGNVHTGTPDASTSSQQSKPVTADDVRDAFHLYGCHWTADTIQFYYDRVAYGAAITTPADCKQDMYLIVNLALGSVAGAVDAAALPSVLRVDYVKVWDAKPF